MPDLKKNRNQEIINTTEQETIDEKLVCSLCDTIIVEEQRFDKIVFIGNTFWYHESCGKQLVFDKLDKKLTLQEKYPHVKDGDEDESE
jgi:hypothetical protein